MKIIQYGIPRSGTTLVYNVLNHIFDDVVKKHNFEPYYPGSKVVITIRDFRDIMVSQWVLKVKKEDANRYMTRNEIKFHANAVKRHIAFNFEKHLRYINLSCLVLRYEMFFENIDYICNEIELFFNICVSEEDREYCKKKFLLENVKKISEKLKTFKVYDKETLIHGNHIFNGHPGQWKNHVKPEDYDIIADILGSYLSNYGYY